MEDEVSNAYLINVNDEKILVRQWSKPVLKQFSSSLNIYISLLKPKSRNGTNEINAEINTVKSMLGTVAKVLATPGRNAMLALPAGNYKLLNDVLWKNYAVLGQILKASALRPHAKGEFEPEETKREELKQIIELPFFTILPRRSALVSDFAGFYSAKASSHPEVARSESPSVAKKNDVKKNKTPRVTEKVDQNVTNIFNGPVGSNIANNAGQVAVHQEVRAPEKVKWWERPLFLTIVTLLGTFIIAYLVYMLGWQ